jgi:hypothetical protein
MTADYRHVNKHTIDCHQPLEHIPNLTYKMVHAKFIFIFDAKSGYQLTPVDSSQKWIKLFITPDGQFSWNRTPLSLKTARYTFTKALCQI